jgi:hypothetical protein
MKVYKYLLVNISFLFLLSSPAHAFLDWEVTLQKLISAIKVSAAQDKTASEQVVNANKQIHEASASTIVTAIKNMKLAEAKHNYSSETGTGYNACFNGLQLKNERASETSAQKVLKSFAEGEKDWFNSENDGISRLTQSLQYRKDLYCTSTEKEKGICKGEKAGSYGAGDSDASIWLLSRNYGAEEVLVSADFIDVVAPMPSIMKNATTAHEDIVGITDIRRGAILSGARLNIMKYVTDGMGGDHDKK